MDGRWRPSSSTPHQRCRSRTGARPCWWRVGAGIRLVDGDREDVARAAIAAVEESGSFYASHVYNPFFFEGTKTFAFELWEQLSGAGRPDRVPDVVVLPAGNGTLVLGAHIG